MSRIDRYPSRSALHLVHTLRGKGIRAGLLELQTLWPFPAELVRDRTEGARNVYVVEMNMGHIMAQVRQAAWKPDRVFLVNRVDGQLITPTDIGKVMRVIEGRGF
jgi:2-oxoglutarate ferredoxin oxidoreductase subunit alpha